jgi:phosphate transport system substrate-binding protein
MACIAQKEGDPCVTPSEETAKNGTYPIARSLLMYTNGEPTGAVANYLNWIKSDAAQCIIMKQGYAPVGEPSCS